MSSGAARATLMGIPMVNTMPIGWKFTTGVAPHTRIFEFHESAVEGMTSMSTGAAGASTTGEKPTWVGSSVHLSITPKQGDALIVENVWVIGEVPSSQPFLRAFMVADVRWLWKRKHIYRFFNVPRRTGETFLFNGVPDQVASLDHKLKYIDWSMKDDKPWTAKDIVKSVADEVIGKSWEFQDEPFGDLPVQSYEIDDSGDSALNRVLANLPGFDLFVDRTGKTRFFNSRDVKKGAHLIESIKSIEGSASPRATDMRFIRPEKIRVLFNRECELRFDSLEETDENDTAGPLGKSMVMENVLRLPDQYLKVGDKMRNRGEWVTVKEAMAAWNENLPEGAPPLKFKLLREMWILGNAIESLYDKLGVRKPDRDWVGRIASLREHFRRTYRINPAWVRRFKSLKMYRLGIFDPITGVRPGSVAMMDFCVECSWRGLSLQVGNQFTHLNVEGYPGADGNPDSDGQPAPALITLLDEHQGIVHIELRTDHMNTWKTMYPSRLVDEDYHMTSVVVDVSKWRNNPLSLDFLVTGGHRPPFLDPAHRVCIIVTAVPAAPNNSGQLHDIEVEPEDAAEPYKKYGRAAAGGQGVPWDVRFGPNLQARILWDQSSKQLYPVIFGFDGSEDGMPSKGIQHMVMNDKLLKETARRVAQSLWGDMISRYEGTKTSHWDPTDDKDIVGNVDVIEHILMPTGQLLSRWTANPTLRKLDPAFFMGDSMRTAVYGILHPPLLAK